MTKIKNKSLSNKKNRTILFFYLIKIRLIKFQNDCLKTEAGYIFLVKQSIFTVFVGSFHKEPLEF